MDAGPGLGKAPQPDNGGIVSVGKDKQQVGVHSHPRGFETRAFGRESGLASGLGGAGQLPRMSTSAPADSTPRANPGSPLPATLFPWEGRCCVPHLTGHTYFPTRFLTSSPPPMHQGYVLLLRAYCVPGGPTVCRAGLLCAGRLHLWSHLRSPAAGMTDPEDRNSYLFRSSPFQTP